MPCTTVPPFRCPHRARLRTSRPTATGSALRRRAARPAAIGVKCFVWQSRYPLSAMSNPQSTPIRSFRDLQAWQTAMDLVIACYGLTKDFPKDERYGLTAQLRIGLEIALPPGSGYRIADTVLTVLEPAHELQTRPHLVYRGDFDVHQAGGQRDGAHDVFRDVRRNARRLLGPGDPDHPRRLEGAQQGGQSLLQLRARFGKELNEGDLTAWRRRHTHPGRESAERGAIPPRRVDYDDRRAGLDAQFRRERSSRVAGGHGIQK